jgi:hypothetical protein
VSNGIFGQFRYAVQIQFFHYLPTTCIHRLGAYIKLKGYAFGRLPFSQKPKYLRLSIIKNVSFTWPVPTECVIFDQHIGYVGTQIMTVL